MLQGSGGTRVSRRWAVAALVLAAALFRVALLAVLPRVVHGDEAAYLLIGRDIWRGLGVSGAQPPLLPLLAGAVWRLTGDPELGTGFWFVVAGALAVVPVYLLAAALCGRRAAWIAAGLVAVYPGLSTAIPFWSSMTEPLFILLVYSGVAVACYAARGERFGRCGWAGALLALAYLTRPEGVLWLGTTAVALLVARRLERGAVGRAAWRGPAWLVAGFLLVALPYVLLVRLDTGRWPASRKVNVTFELGEAVLRDDPELYDRIANTLDGTAAQAPAAAGARPERGLAERALREPGALLRRVGRNLGRLIERAATQTIFPLSLLALVVVAWTLRPPTRRRLAADVWIAAAALPVAAFLVFHIEQRYVCPAFPALLVWVAAGLDELARRLLRPPRAPARVAALVAIAAVVAAVVVLGHRQVYVAKRDGVFPSRREAGLWLRDHAPGARVMAFDDGVCVYADCAFVPSPRAPYEAWIEHARRRGASYLVVEADEVRYRPYLAPLLDGAPRPELEPVFRGGRPASRVVVYRLRAG